MSICPRCGKRDDGHTHEPPVVLIDHQIAAIIEQEENRE